MSKDSLKNLKILVVGGGPGGLTFARSAKLNGAEIEIIEHAGDPRGDDAGYTDLSFNLTLNNVGRAAIGDDSVLKESIDVVGRAMENFLGSGQVEYASYGEGDPARLTSLPRPALRQSLVESCISLGVKFRFDTQVEELMPDRTEIKVEQNGQTEVLTADLIVVADGLHSMADPYIEAMGGSLNKREEPYNYVTVVIGKDKCQGLSLHHIHFWHQTERDTISIGVPNKDGSIAVLMVSKFADVPKGQSPFGTALQSLERVKADFPQLLELDNTIPERLIGRKRGRFYYKTITNYLIGERMIVIGDAGTTVPPWAAFGANTALYSADALVRFLVGIPDDLQAALESFESYQLVFANLVAEFVAEHGNFLTGRVVEHPEERSSSPVLGQLVNRTELKANIPEGVKLLSFPEL